MEKELNYLSEKIEKLEQDISLGDFCSFVNPAIIEGIKIDKKEKEILENILNKITEIELTSPSEKA